MKKKLLFHTFLFACFAALAQKPVSKTIHLDTRPLLQKVTISTNADKPVVVENHITLFNLEVTIKVEATPKYQLNPSIQNLKVTKIAPKFKEIGESEQENTTQNGNIFSIPLALTEGNNIFKIEYQISQDRKITKEVRIDRKKEYPNLFVVSIGVDYSTNTNVDQLLHATSDAKSINAVFETQKTEDIDRIFGHVYSLVLTTKEETSADQIPRLVRQFLNTPGRPIREKDFLSFFLSSHGDTSKLNGPDDKSWYIAASNYAKFTIEDRRKSTVNYQTEILPILDRFNCKKLVMLDACFSGQTLGTPSYRIKGITNKDDIRQRIIKYLPGYYVITGSQYQALELKDQGALSKSIKMAFENGDADQSGYISLYELHKYISEWFSNSSNTEGGIQTPVFSPKDEFPKLDIFEIPKKR